MKLYRVAAISLFFTTEPQREFNIRYFTVMYLLRDGKSITKNYLHSERNMKTALELPIAVEVDEEFICSLPSGIPTPYEGVLRICISR